MSYEYDSLLRLSHLYSWDSHGDTMQSIGYKELAGYLDGSSTLEEGAALIKQKTRNYAKRQLTWFRAQPGIVWLDGGANDLFARAETTVAAWLSDQ